MSEEKIGGAGLLLLLWAKFGVPMKLISEGMCLWRETVVGFYHHCSLHLLCSLKSNKWRPYCVGALSFLFIYFFLFQLIRFQCYWFVLMLHRRNSWKERKKIAFPFEMKRSIIEAVSSILMSLIHEHPISSNWFFLFNFRRQQMLSDGLWRINQKKIK